MDNKINHRLAFIQNRCTICVYEKYKFLRNIHDFSWTSVSKIICFTNDSKVCSICFDKIILARMDRCGHIFCLSCILSVFDVNKSNHAPCPMCKDVEISINSLKRVEFHEQKLPIIGEPIKLSLLVKGQQNVCPRFAHFLTSYKDYNLPKLENSISKFLSIVTEKDFRSQQDIIDDLNLIKCKLKQKSKLNKFPRNNLEKLLLNLKSELKHFQDEIKVINKNEIDENCEIFEDNFNLIEYKNMKEKFELFYQAEGYRFVFLDQLNQKQILDKSQHTWKVVPVQIKSTIREIREEFVDNEFLMRTKLSHLFRGVKVTIVTIDLPNALLEPITGGNLRILRSHQEQIYKARKEDLDMRERIAKRAAERRSLPPRQRVLTTVNTENAQYSRLFDMIAEGFNTCTLGIECLVPDDDYPHAQDCEHYASAKHHLSPLETAPTDEKFLGILRMKLNVFHPDAAAAAADNEALQPAVVTQCPSPAAAAVVPLLHAPPERLSSDELSLIKEANRIAPYIVPRKPKSQNQQKKLRKLQKQSMKAAS